MSNEEKKPIFSFSGQVIHGKGNGKTVGMPTANLKTQQTQLPSLGVYASLVHMGEKRYLGATNVGHRPSCTDEDHDKISIETFILDFDGDLYGDTLQVDLYYFLRPTIKMNSLSQVQQQVHKDCERVRALLSDLL